MGKVRWSEKASSNLENIHDYIAKDSPLFATKFITYLIKSTKILEDMPNSGRIVPELEDYGFREIIMKGYRIVYKIFESTMDVEILAIVHSSRNVGIDIVDEN